jgi:hypothetical protein
MFSSSGGQLGVGTRYDLANVAEVTFKLHDKVAVPRGGVNVILSIWDPVASSARQRMCRSGEGAIDAL